MDFDTMLAEAIRERDNWDNVVAALQATRREATLSAVKPDEFKGQEAMVAMHNYLRAQRGAKVPMSQIVDALERGGAYRGKAGRPFSHTLKIGLGNNTHIFDWEPKSISPKGKPIAGKGVPNRELLVSLTATANDPKPRRRNVLKAKPHRRKYVRRAKAVKPMPEPAVAEARGLLEPPSSTTNV